MSLSSELARNDFVGNDAANTYTYGFRIFANTDLLVTVRDLSTPPLETTLQLTTDYTVTGVGDANGGTIVLVNSGQDWLTGGGNLKNGFSITIRRVRPLTQTTDIRNQGSFFPETHEDSFDHGVMLSQQQQDELDRSFKLPETEAGSVAATILPVSATRASNFLAFDASGNPIASPGVTSVPLSVFVGTLVDDADGSEFMTTIRDNLASETAPASDDEVFLRDTSATAVDRMTLADLLKVVDVLAAETSPATGDELLLYDASAAAADKITLADMLKVVNELSENVNHDPAADFLLSYDASPSSAKKFAVGKMPTWQKFTKSFSDFATAATTNSITLYTASAGEILHAVKIKHSASFTGGGISAYTIGLGISGDTERYASQFDVFQASSDTDFQLSQTLHNENHGSTQAVLATAVSTGANLDQASAGSVDIWVLRSVQT